MTLLHTFHVSLSTISLEGGKSTIIAPAPLLIKLRNLSSVRSFHRTTTHFRLSMLASSPLASMFISALREPSAKGGRKNHVKVCTIWN